MKHRKIKLEQLGQIMQLELQVRELGLLLVINEIPSIEAS